MIVSLLYKKLIKAIFAGVASFFKAIFSGICFIATGIGKGFVGFFRLLGRGFENLMDWLPDIFGDFFEELIDTTVGILKWGGAAVLFIVCIGCWIGVIGIPVLLIEGQSFPWYLWLSPVVAIVTTAIIRMIDD